MPCSSSETAMYSTVQVASEPRMPIGRSRCGLRVSSATVETASKPRYAKKIVAAPVMMPTTPKCVSPPPPKPSPRSEEQTSELQSLMRISYAVFCLKKKKDIDHI